MSAPVELNIWRKDGFRQAYVVYPLNSICSCSFSWSLHILPSLLEPSSSQLTQSNRRSQLTARMGFHHDSDFRNRELHDEMKTRMELTLLYDTIAFLSRRPYNKRLIHDCCFAHGLPVICF